MTTVILYFLGMPIAGIVAAYYHETEVDGMPRWLRFAFVSMWPLYSAAILALLVFKKLKKLTSNSQQR